MNLSQKCNCCIKQDVCRISEFYTTKSKEIKDSLPDEMEVSIKCKHFAVNKTEEKQPC